MAFGAFPETGKKARSRSRPPQPGAQRFQPQALGICSPPGDPEIWMWVRELTQGQLKSLRAPRVYGSEAHPKLSMGAPQLRGSD